MKKFNLIVLAGGDKGPLYDTYGCAVKAMLPIHGKPMLDIVLKLWEESQCIDNTIVVGPAELDNLDNINLAHTRIFEGFHLVQNLIHAISYIKYSIYDEEPDHDGYLISFCDAVFLTPDIIKDTLNSIRDSNADIVLNYIEKQSFIDKGLPTNRTWIELDGQNYTGSTIYYVKRFSPILQNLYKLVKLRANRKDPKGILKVLGCDDSSLLGIEESLSKELDLKVKINVSPHPELGMDVDKKQDYLDALNILKLE